MLPRTFFNGNTSTGENFYSSQINWIFFIPTRNFSEMTIFWRISFIHLLSRALLLFKTIIKSCGKSPHNFAKLAARIPTVKWFANLINTRYNPSLGSILKILNTFQTTVTTIKFHWPLCTINNFNLSNSCKSVSKWTEVLICSHSFTTKLERRSFICQH